MFLTDTEGLPHSTTGPAIDIDNKCGWYIHGKPYTNFKDFQEAGGLTDDQMTILKLKYGNSFHFTSSQGYIYAPYIPLAITTINGIMYTPITPKPKVTLWSYVKLLYRKYMK